MWLRDWAELIRVSNLPTCVSNVLVGVSIGAAGAALPSVATFGWLVAGIALMYVAGMALNGAADVEVDRRERPGRPIPSGRIGLPAAYAFAGICLAGGLGVLGSFGPAAAAFALVLALTIVAYDLLHLQHGTTVILIGACRGLVYLVSAAAVAWPFDARLGAWLAVMLTTYTVVVSVVARGEASGAGGPGRWSAVALPSIVPLAGLGAPFVSPAWALATGLLATVWLARTAFLAARRPPRTVAAVLSGLAGICLLDAYFLALLGRPGLVPIAIACFLLTAWGHRRVLGT